MRPIFAFPDFCLSGLQESWKSIILPRKANRAESVAKRGDAVMPSGRVEASEDGNPTEPEKGTSLNFKVSQEFKKEFKGFAVAQGISMTDLLKEGFILSKKKRQK
jgi:hypothetical protein